MAETFNKTLLLQKILSATENQTQITTAQFSLIEAAVTNLEAGAVHVDPTYTGTVENGQSATPYKSLQFAADSVPTKTRIKLLTGYNAVQLDPSKSYIIECMNDAILGFETWDTNNPDAIEYIGPDPQVKTEFIRLINPVFRNCKYGAFTKNLGALICDTYDAKFCGWSGRGFNPEQNEIRDFKSDIVALGKNSDMQDLVNFFAGTEISANNDGRGRGGGAIRTENVTTVICKENRIKRCFRGARYQDSGVNYIDGNTGFTHRGLVGIVTGRSEECIESGLYFAAGDVWGGCQNVYVANYVCNDNANNGALIVGGIDISIASLSCNRNWSSGLMNWGGSNVSVKVLEYKDNCQYHLNGIGNPADALADIAVSDAYSLLGTTVERNPDYRYIFKCGLATCNNTGYGTSAKRTAFKVLPAVGLIPPSDYNLISVDNLQVQNADVAADFKDLDATHLSISIHNCEFVKCAEPIIYPDHGNITTQPYSNHIVNPSHLDFCIDATGAQIGVKDNSGQVWDYFGVNTLEAVANGANVSIIINDSKKAIFDDVPLQAIKINGNPINSILNLGIADLNGLFTNTVSFDAPPNPVTSFDLNGNTLTITNEDSTQFSVDLTSIVVHQDKYAASGALNGSDLVLTMTDGDTVTIDVTAIQQPSSVNPAFAPEVVDQTYQVTTDQPFNVQLAKEPDSSIVAMWAKVGGPAWAIMNQASGVLSGTAPSTAQTAVVNAIANNSYGGNTSFNATLEVIEPVYTNTKSLLFRSNVQSWLGANAGLCTSLQRSGNGGGAGDAFTIAFWFKGSTNDDGQTLFYFGHHDVVNQGYIEIRQTANQSTGLKRLRVRYGSNNNNIQLSTPDGSVTPNQWQFFMLTYTGEPTGSSSGSLNSYYSAFGLYLNGVAQATNNSHSNYGYSGQIDGNNFRFGRFASGSYPKGVMLNQLAIWDSDQSANAALLYNNGSPQDLTLLDDKPAHYYEVEDNHTILQDLIGGAHMQATGTVITDLVDDAP